MANSTARLTNDALAFLTERHLAMLTTLRPDNSPHVVGVLSQGGGPRWLSLEGQASVMGEIDAVRDAELRYAQRYRTPRENPRRVVIEVHIERVLGSSDP